MKIEVIGSRCYNCRKFTQFYWMNRGDAEAIDKGYCGLRQRLVRPGDRCGKYFEKSNIGGYSKE